MEYGARILIEKAREERNTSLDLSSQFLTDISALKDLTQLTQLNLSNNQINDISVLKNLTKLSILYIYNNQISDISTLKNLTKLTLLDLQTNKISDISVLEKLPRLRTVALNNNKITHLPSWVIKREFKIKNNDFSESGFFTIEDNPLVQPPIEVVDQGHDAVVRFFQELDKGAARLYEAKLLLVGEGGVGKTTLVRKLNEADAAMPAKEERTRGIDITRYKFSGDEGKEISLNIWDFGGQDIYHATHRFFLTHRSFYLLLTETRRQDDNFDYWIPNIRLFAGNSPILIIKNLMDGFQRHISIGEFMKNDAFNIPERIFDVNLKDASGLSELKKAIHYQIQKLPHMGQELPVSWVKIRKAVEELSIAENVISYERFADVCREHGLTDTEKIADLGNYFHDLGIILWYREIPLLKSKVILNPNWATNAVYLLIDDDEIAKHHGLFTRAMAAAVWKDETYRSMTDELLELMKAFRLCYQKRNSAEYLIPSLLPADPLKGLCWDDADNLRLNYFYEFMPKGIVNQLTAELHRYIEDDECVWSRGVIFKDIEDDVRAKVEEVRKSKLLCISIKGQNARGFMRLIMNSIDEIHSTYPGIEVMRQVPCRCASCVNNPKPTIFDYDKLIRWIKAGEKTKVCNESNESLEIEKILYNIGVRPGRERGVEMEPLKVFFSYSKADLVDAQTLRKFLNPLERNGDIAIWFDRDMEASTEWDSEIKRRLETADIILFLVSADFLATDYIRDIEIPKALERYKNREVKIVPIILRPCAWEGKYAPFSHLLALPEKAKPISTYNDRDEAWMKVFKGIEKIIGNLQTQLEKELPNERFRFQMLEEP